MAIAAFARSVRMQTRRSVAARPTTITRRASAVASQSYVAEPKGDIESMDWRMYFTEGGKAISPWHDIPLSSSGSTYNFVCEIPKETKAKMECSLDEKTNPIKQDTKKGALRFYPYNINWNYGFLPQTWEDPAHKNEGAGDVFGDNDPVDVVEISSTALEMGGVYEVKCVGAYAMIDDGELDWKVIAINTADPMAEKINDVEDVEREMPGELNKVMEWFRDYKIPDGKPANAYGYDSKCMNAEFTKGVIAECNGMYTALKTGERKNDVEVSLE